MNTLFNFLSNIAETKLIIIGGIALLTLIPLALLLKPVIIDVIQIIKRLLDKGNKK
ncbi:BlyA family holin (plasmid) [Borrelia nietonii YOR]|nr:MULTISPECIES: BlyA family holin [Borrelia]UPA09895.1 BlyA family holin [Borrelia nietonii YOR]